MRPNDAGEYKCACVVRNILASLEKVACIVVRSKLITYMLWQVLDGFQILPHLIESSLAICDEKMWHHKYPKLCESIDLWNLIPDHRYDINIRICMGKICASHGKIKNVTIIHFQ